MKLVLQLVLPWCTLVEGKVSRTGFPYFFHRLLCHNLAICPAQHALDGRVRSMRANICDGRASSDQHFCHLDGKVLMLPLSLGKLNASSLL